MTLLQLLSIANIWLIKLSSSQSLPTGIVFSITECGNFPDYQIFTEDNSSGQYTIFSVKNWDQTCIDCDFCEVGVQPWTWDCDNGNSNQYWNIINLSNNKI